MHISQLRNEERVRDVNDVVRRGQKVKVKVLSITGKKMSLSMKVRQRLLNVVVYFVLCLHIVWSVHALTSDSPT